MYRLLLPLLLTACAARQEGEYVRKVYFVGNDQEKRVDQLFNPERDGVLREVIEQPYGEKPLWEARSRPRRWLQRGTRKLFKRENNPSLLDPSLLQSDALRLETWYAHQGYFDARVTGWAVVKHRRPRRGIQALDVVGYVEKGKPSVVREVKISGIEQLSGPLQDRVRDAVALNVGEVFSRGNYQGTVVAVERILQNQTYAFARVDGAVNVDDLSVDIVLDVVPGRPCRYGEISIVGEEKIPERRIRDVVDIAADGSYHLSDLARVRTKLYELRVFSLVNVVPDFEHADGNVIPIRIEVREGKTRSARTGVSAGFDPGLLYATVGVELTENNFLGQLWHLESDAEAGAAIAAETVSTSEFEANAGPILGETLTLDMPRLFMSDFGMVHQVSLKRGVEPLYDQFEAEYFPALTWTGIPRTTLLLGYRIRYVDYINPVFDLEDIAKETANLDATDPYKIGMLEQKATYDARDDLVYTSRGYYLSGAVAEAGGPFGGDYQFVKVEGETRGYISTNRLERLWGVENDLDLVFAGRLGAGMILPYGETGTVPYAEHFYLGGGSSVRGWAPNRLGPVTRLGTPNAECDFITSALGVEGADPNACGQEIPIGGLWKGFTNLEVRKGIPWNLSVAAFVDGGRVWNHLANVVEKPPQWTVGGGVRYRSPVGPIRLDVGYRLGEDPEFVNEPHLALNLGLSEAF